jgi:ParB family transcriptional regulator, chromosome partitioning protein
MPRNALGKGLGALIREPEPVDASVAPASAAATAAAPALAPAGPSGAQMVDIDLIEPSPFQPRTRFREEALEELARSISTNGIIQPLVLRAIGSRFQLIAGERRWRAAQRAGLRRVPSILRDVPEELALEITLVENIQREDLNPIEQARAFERLLTEFHLTQEDVAVRTGKDRATVANALRLLKLEKTVLEAIEDGKISAGHGRALLGVADPKLRAALAVRAARGGLTVRQIERIGSRRARIIERGEEAPAADPNVRAAIEELQRHLATRVTLRPPSNKFPGQLRIEYYEDSQLSGIYEKLMR